MKTSDQTNELFTALAKAQAEMGVAKEDGFNKHLGAGYASLSSLQAAYREPCAKFNLAIIQNVYSEGEDYFVETRVAHGSGQWMASSIKVLLVKRDMQSLGSAVTYAKRYAITSLLGISTEVDEEEVQAVSNKVQASRRIMNSAAQTGQELREKLKANPRPIMNHATGEVREPPKVSEAAMDKAANPKTGTVGVVSLVGSMNQEKAEKEAERPSPPLDWASWDHRITFGKYAGKTIRDVGYSNALEYFKWLEGQAGGKKLSIPAEMLGQALKSP